MASAGTRSVRAALIGNLLVAATKAVAAFITGSSAMLAETVHSIVDTGNQLLMLYGIRQSQQRPDALHPIGYGRELYFWSFIVALLLFGAGACVSCGNCARTPSPPAHCARPATRPRRRCCKHG